MKDAGVSNQKIYESLDVVHRYSLEHGLQRAEETILNIVKEKLSSMKMLDIGVGVGRTVEPFGRLVKEYVGVDYSQKMINACQEKFKNMEFRKTFAVCDARAMAMFPGNTFDFILFSYNGIDYMNHDDRLSALREIKRVAKPGSLFCFSSHNILCLERYLNIAMCCNPLRLLKIFERYIQIKNIISSYGGVENVPFAVISDGGEEFRLKTHYIHPHEQLRNLKEIGFCNICVFAETTGDEITDHAFLARTKEDRWLYFLCTIHKP